MTRELDWKIHELMGNDLTLLGAKYIPHYSTTWEGAGLVMEACRQQDWEVNLSYYESMAGWIYCAGLRRGDQYAYLTATDPSAPLALAKAFISAMEGRNNG